MVAFNKPDVLPLDLGTGSHNFTSGATAVLKLALTNTAPTAASTVWSLGSFPAPTAANGYTAGGNTPGFTSFTQTGGVAKLVLVDSVFTASAGGIGPFQYVILYNTSSTGTANKIVGYYNYGSAVTLADTETFTVDFDPTLGALTIT
jgi:hypothetical protein